MKWIVNNILSKLVLGALAIILQIGWMIYMVERATQISNIFNYVLHILALLLALHIINKDTKLYFKLSWVFFILCLPIAGCPCYFFFGRSELTRKRRRQLTDIYQQINPYRKEDVRIKQRLKEEDTDAWRQSEYITNYAHYPIYEEEDTKYYPSGEEMYEDLLCDLKSAREYIFMEYFILAPGKMLDSIVEILEQKAAEGVHVRLIFDDVGSIRTLPIHYSGSLQEKGIHCALFHPFRPFLSIIMNNRDHRKICSIDGRIAYTGGVNLADEYINHIERFGYWKDNAIRITGAGAWGFTMMFMELWEYCVHGKEECDRFCPPEFRQEKLLSCKLQPQEGRHGYVQPFSDSPLDREYTSENVYLNIINRAKEYVYIFTPYLITSEELDTALVNAAKSGVDVRIVTPGTPDKKIAYLLTQSNYEHLISGGVKIYQYTPGFIHSKCIIADDRYAVVGTINLDYRSLYLHFECGVYLYHVSAIDAIKRDMTETFAVSHQVSLEERQEKNFFVQLFLSVLRLLAPLF